MRDAPMGESPLSIGLGVPIPQSTSDQVPNAKLTIGIPTFRRPECLAARLQELMPQLDSATVIVIQDNASPDGYDTVISEALRKDYQSRISFRRNEINIGAVGNVLRLIENCDTEWLWLLGDDDITAVGAVEMVLTATLSYPDARYIEFSSPWGTYQEKCTAFGTSGLAKCATFGNLLFLSSGVYRVKYLREHMDIGYAFASSMAPHVALLVSSLGPKDMVVFLPDRLILGFEEPFHWSLPEFYLRFPLLCDIAGDSEGRNEFRLFIARAFPLRTLFFHLWTADESTMSASRKTTCFIRAATRNVDAITGPLALLELLAEATALRWPRVLGGPLVKAGRALSALAKGRTRK